MKRAGRRNSTMTESKSALSTKTRLLCQIAFFYTAVMPLKPSKVQAFHLPSFPLGSQVFQLSSRDSPSYSIRFSVQTPRRRCLSPLTASDSDDNFEHFSDEEENDDEDDIDPNSLGDWRAFRMNLANSGLSSTEQTTSTSDASVDGISLSEQEDESASVTSISSFSAPPTSQQRTRPRSVSKQNEQLLKGQNKELAEEYLNGVWAHESATPEVGGLICRMPLEAEIYRGDKRSIIHQKLRQLLDSDDYDRTESIQSSLSSASSATPSSSLSQSSSPPDFKSSIASTPSSPSPDDGDDPVTFSALAAKTVFWYRGAEKLLKREMARIVATANGNGKIDANDLDEESLELLQIYMDQQQRWQEVCLVIERDEKTGSAQTVTINRPMAFKLSESMGRLVLLGAHNGKGTTRTEQDGKETQNLVKFLTAFESQCGVYVGGTDDMDKPAVMIHGIADLPGSEEISPGTGIYKGGVEAAMDGVLAGKFKPLDFRFFIGHSKYVGGELDEAVNLGKYQPVACSRPLVLKQCIQLPKPLWHEVLEFCGGELKEISKLEFAKRSDL